MAISIDWGTRIISVPQADLTFVSGTLYALDTFTFRLSLKDLEDDEEGMPYPDTHTHNTEVTIAGVTYARTIEIINNYTITFEDGQYAVRLDGSNNNFFDEGIINRNQVSIIPTNSAGLQIVSVGSGLSTEEQGQLADIHGQTRRAVYMDSAASGGGDGYQQTPFDTMTQALTDAATADLSTIHAKGQPIIAGGDDIQGFDIHGSSIVGTVTTVGSLSPTTVVSDERTQFHNMTITGAVTSNVVFQECLINDFAAATVIANNSLLSGTITLVPQAGSPLVIETSHFVNCRSSVDEPTIEFNGGGHEVNLKDYAGNLTLSNLQSNDTVEIALNGGTITIDALSTAGIVTVTGIGEVIDNSGGAVTIIEDNLIFQAGGRGFGGM